MRRAVLVFALLLPAMAQAQTVSCSVSGLNAKQTALLADFLAAVNSQRAAQTPPLAPFATFNAYCSDLLVSTVVDYVRQQDKVNAAKISAASEANGFETAPAGQCTATGQAAGCSKNSIACFALTGNITCAP